MSSAKKPPLTAKSTAKAKHLWAIAWDHLKAFVADLLDVRMLPIKLLFFMELAGIVTIWPHMSTHMAHLRLTAEETGLIVMLGGVAGIVAALSAGYIGDKMGNFKMYLGLALLIEGVAGVCLVLLPPAVQQVVPPGDASLNHHCVDDYLHINWRMESCEPHFSLASLNVTLRECRLSCHSVNGSQPSVGQLHCGDDPASCSVLFPPPSLATGAPLSVLMVNSTDNSTRLHAVPAGGGGARPVACPPPALAQSCRLQCADALPLSVVCAPRDDRQSHSLTLWLYVFLRVVYSFCLGTTYTLIDTTVLSYCALFSVDYGFQRLWGTVAALIVSPLSGKIMDLFSTVGMIEFRPGFYTMAAFRFLSLVVLYFVNIGFRHSPSGSLFKYTIKLFQKIELTVLFLVMLLTGMAVGHIETFSYVFLSQLGASGTLIGTTITVGSAVELVMLSVSGLCMSAVGQVGLIVLGMVIYAVRLIGYSLIVDPSLSLLLEALDGVNSGLMNAAVVTYAASKVEPELVATVRGILGCFLFGGGRAVGAQLGGYLVARFGHRVAFRIFAGVALFAAAAYALFQLAMRRRRSGDFQPAPADSVRGCPAPRCAA
ncbi:major facilitator superfamily domain-containing protein 6-like isoform X2 [Amphibalanus amphitrite]|uniref:major facilitator superfamily domain-containing protein 6-like isoform X2 n=1 Tax=Amphibalanus amphitrite TaxID=1232801 RepID=UPI001C92A75B|nr:major facilitator superfamily domain-containing protein 6-like isoform X2 [Amphibalanus amphitrite]